MAKWFLKNHDFIHVNSSVVWKYNKHKQETIIHLFVHCHVVRRFWSTLQGWLLNNFGLRMLLTGKNIMFPSERRGGLMNYLYVVAKYYIYANKFSGYELHIESFESILKRKFQSEKYIANLNNTFTNFIKKWSTLYAYLN